MTNGSCISQHRPKVYLRALLKCEGSFTLPQPLSESVSILSDFYLLGWFVPSRTEGGSLEGFPTLCDKVLDIVTRQGKDTFHVMTWNRPPAISLAKMDLFRISRELQFRICIHVQVVQLARGEHFYKGGNGSWEHCGKHSSQVFLLAESSPGKEEDTFFL